MGIDKNNVQGDIWSKGFMKRNETYYFFSIANPKAFPQCLKKLAAQVGDASLITSLTQAEKDRKRADEANSLNTTAAISNALIAFTRTGLEVIQSALPDTPLKLGRLKTTDPAFYAGMAAPANGLNDPDATQWDPLFKPTNTPIHGLLKIAGSDADKVEKKLQAILTVLQHGTVIVDVKGISPPNVVESRVDGAVRPNKLNLNDQELKLNGKEHFGFEDGISQPLIKGIDTLELEVPNVANMNTDEEIIFLSKLSPSSDTSLDRPLDWMESGTFLVFRKLEQNVDAFNTLIKTHNQHNCSSEKQMGAKLMGRWESGAPIVSFPDNDPLNPVDRKDLNKFNYSGDSAGNVCPFAAHTRKTNQRKPRNQNEKSTFQTRIIRNGIPYGSEFSEKPLEQRGLLFACYQSHIETGFKFLQSSWANNVTFSTRGAGHDPIIGQTPNKKLTMSISGSSVNFDQMVTMKGGEYFFVPSISALQTKLGQG